MIFENVGSSLIGRKLHGSLSPFLCIGESFASLSFCGKLPVLKHLFMISVSGGARLFAHNFTNFGDTSSKPEDVLDVSELMNCHVCVLLISCNWNLFCLLSSGGRNSLKSDVCLRSLSLLVAAVWKY